MSESVAICTYSQDKSLFRVCREFTKVLPHKHIALYNWRPTYTTDLLTVDADWIIHIDEDAFMFDTTRLDPLLTHMEEQGYVCAGMPDGGVLDIRFHNPIACNAFFLVLHRKAILPYVADFEQIRNCRWRDEYREWSPAIALRKGYRYEYCECEPFYGLYFWLCAKRLRILHLDAEEWTGEPERTSCILKDHTGQPFVLHTWYSRFFRQTALPVRSAALQLLRSLAYMIPLFNRGQHFERICRAMDYVRRTHKHD